MFLKGSAPEKFETDRSENLQFRVCCLLRCSLCSFNIRGGAETYPKFSNRNIPQSITQKGVHAHPLTAPEREHWFLQHLSHFIAVNFGRQ